MSLSTDQIERQAENHRAHISELLDELRYRVTPGEVVDQFLGWDNGREIAQNFGRQVRDNPMPLALIGAGLAWLMMSDGSAKSRSIRGDGEGYGTYGSYTGSASDSMSDAAASAKNAARRARRSAADLSQRTRDTMSDLSDRVGEPASDLSDSAQSALDTTRQKASDLADTAQSAYGRTKETLTGAANTVSDTASAAWERTRTMAQSTADTASQASSNLNRLMHDQPLLVAGIGFAVGIALAAMVPMTETEHHLMGEESDDLKQRAGELASEGYQKAKTVAQKTYDAATDTAREEAQHQGLTPGSQSQKEYSERGTLSHGRDDGDDYGSSPYRHH
jgi:ElaB/YqjD/DUF883 family membrane-anchored ribosome-binding protein